ncbi:MAG TPA: RNA 2',3'-cyclic phosphodiesterase [Bryobacteraceae bacterium]|nr:RNA 2',3'-cyclic phosphodiesterase [Bryobacteraceae bacterium]
MRLFVALQVPDSVRNNYAKLIEDLRRLDAVAAPKKPKWVRPENLHVTLKFIGHTDPAKLDAIRVVLAKVRSPEEVCLHFRSIVFFPSAKRPRVIWGGTEASENLAPLAQAVDKQIATLGFPAEQRAFTPHLTLARLDPPGIAPELRTAIETQAECDFGELHSSEFHLIESKLKPSGAEYTTLQSFPFVSKV